MRGNIATGSPNPMHNDAGAARYGFPRALVPGNTTYAYVADSVTEVLGENWNEHSRTAIRFTAPVYENDQLRIVVEPEPTSSEPGKVSFSVTKEDDARCAVGTAELLSPCAARPSIAEFPDNELPLSPHSFSEEFVLDHEQFGSLNFEVKEADQREYLEKIGAPRGPVRKSADSAWLAKWYWPLVGANVAREGSAGIHVAEDLTHYREVSFGEVLSARGRYESLYGRRGNRYSVIKVGLIDAADEVVMVALQTGIYRYVPHSPT